MNAHLQQLQQFILQYQKVEQNLGSIQQAQSKLEQDQIVLNELIQKFGTPQQIESQLEQKQKLREQQQAQLNQLDLIQQKLQHYFELNKDREALAHQLSNTQQQHQQLDQQLQTSQGAFQSAKNEREKLQQILQQQRLLHAENIEHLRAELKHGEACLVCGSTEHPYRDDASQLSKALYELQQQQEQQAIQQEQQCFQLWQNTQQQFTQIRTELTQLQSAVQQADDKFKLQHQELVKHAAQFEILLDLTQSHAKITTVQQQYINEATQFKQQIEIELQQLHQANKDHYHLTQTIQNIRYQLESVQQLQQQIQHVVDCLTSDEQNLWQQQTLSSAQQLAQRLQQRVQQIEQAETLSKQQEQLEQQLNLLKTNLTSLNTQHAEFSQQLKDVELKGKQNTESAHQLIVVMTGLTEVKANEWLNQHDQQRQQLQNQYQQIKQRFEQARQNFEQQKNELEQLKAQQQQQQTTVTQTKTEIRAWLNQHPEFEEHQLADLLAIRAEQEQHIRTSLQHAERLLNEAASALKTLQHQLQIHQQQQPPIEHTQLIEYIHLNHEKLQQQAEQRDQFKLKLEVHQQNLAKQKQFADQIQQIQQQEHRWNKISSLIGDSKGKDFRDLAQQYNLDILLEYANQQLAMLSQRYTLKRLDNSLSLAIIDHDMDGETRSVASLSGGESFLTALAISLAIANMASGSMKIESLFIDEGFGTLDASSLHMVMNALDQLQSQGRKVVLISHIQEMHERIPVQIQVQPIGSGSSRIEVVG